MSISKNKIAEIKKLAQKKFREESDCFIVEGTKSVGDLLRSKLKVVEVFATESWLAEHADLTKNVNVVPVSETELERITALTTPQQVLAVAQRPHYSLADIDFADALLVLDGIRDPGNLGTIVRTADWFGFKQIVCSPDSVELTNPKVIQATMGSFSRMKVLYLNLPDFLKNAKIKGKIYGTFMQGRSIETVDFQQNDVLIIGNEGKGISAEVEKLVTDKIHIPSFAHSADHAESLNASIAAAVVMYRFRM